MIAHTKAADRGNGQAASKTTHAGCDPSQPAPNRLASIFIQVDARYAIGADTHAWHILERYRYKGGHRWEPIAWYATAEQCVNALADRAVRTCGAQTLVDTLAESKRIISTICGALRPRFKVEVRS